MSSREPDPTDTGSPTEITLDPENWDSMIALAQEMAKVSMEYLRDVRERPVWKRVPPDTRRRLEQTIPLEGEGADQVWRDFQESVLPYPLGNIHPRFWGWVNGTGTAMGALADLLAATMNSNLAAPVHGPGLVELQVLDWCKEMLGYPPEASGLLVTGGSMANTIGLTVARRTKAPIDISAEGVGALEKPMVAYCSAETHSSVDKAMELLGLGRANLHRIPVDADYRIDLGALRDRIKLDLDSGTQPFCIIGNAGTVNTGAFDDLEALGTLAREHGVWFHVDGAFGGLAAISPRLRHLVRGIEHADSVTFDLHKWMFIPIEVGCILVRDAAAHANTFSTAGVYLGRLAGGIPTGEMTWFSDLGIELTRGFRALKVWMSLKTHGLQKFARIIEQNVDQTRHLAKLIEREPSLEILAPVSLNIVCFRYREDGLDDEALDSLNQRIVIELHERGLAVPSYTRIGGRFCIRPAITNHRTRREDLKSFIHDVVQLGDELSHMTGS